MWIFFSGIFCVNANLLISSEKYHQISQPIDFPAHFRWKWFNYATCWLFIKKFNFLARCGRLTVVLIWHTGCGGCRKDKLKDEKKSSQRKFHEYFLLFHGQINLHFFLFSFHFSPDVPRSFFFCSLLCLRLKLTFLRFDEDAPGRCP